MHKVKVFEKVSCEGVLSTHPVGFCGSLSTVNETNCNKKEIRAKKMCELISNFIRTCPTTMCLTMNAIVFVDLDGDALQLVLLIRNINDFSSSLEEECHLLYCSGEIGSSTCSPDSRCKRFLIETAAQKSDRSFTGSFLPALFKVRYHCPWYLFFPSGVRRYVWSSCASSSNSLHFWSIHPIHDTLDL